MTTDEVQMAEERSASAVQQAMKQLSQYINGTEKEVQRLARVEVHLTERNAVLTAAVNGAERQLLESREETRRLAAREKELSAQVRDLTLRAEQGDEALRRRAEDAEARAAVYGEQNEELAAMAKLGESLTQAGQKMVNAIERLPTKMEDASMARTTPSAIPLYDTYEWQAVSDARFEILRALGEPAEEIGG
jgi:chromosome segregation ATPase